MGRRAGFQARHFAAVLVALVGCGAFGAVLAAYESQRAAEAQLAGLRGAIESYTALRGEPPGRLADLGWRLPALFPTAALEDPWGGAWAYRVPGTQERLYDLTSPGPDGALGGGDDLGDAVAR